MVLPEEIVSFYILWKHDVEFAKIVYQLTETKALQCFSV